MPCQNLKKILWWAISSINELTFYYILLLNWELVKQLGFMFFKF